MIKRTGLIILVILLATSLAMPIDASPSSWAEDQVRAMLLLGMTNPDLLVSENLQDPITREEFAELIVHLYAEANKVSVSSIPQWNPFVDTDNPMVARAYNLGIVNGRSVLDNGQRTFAPDDKVTREEMAVMLVNELDLLGINTRPSYTRTFADQDQISKWAYDQMAFATENDIFRGMSGNRIAPKDQATREQALSLVYRIAEKYLWLEEDVLEPRFTWANSSQTYGFFRPDRKVSQLQSYASSTSLTFRVSYLVDTYKVDIVQQQEDLLHILAISDQVTYDSLYVLKGLIEGSFDKVSKTFNNQPRVYIDRTTGNIQDVPFDSDYFELRIDDALVLTYRP